MIVDLFCGLGRFPGENVVSIDVQRKVKPTIIADVRYLPLRAKLRPRLVHASPPCKYFSYGSIRKYGYNEKGLGESLRLVAACFDAFAYLEPDTWTLENPNGLLRRIVPPNAKTHYTAYDLTHKETDFWSDNRELKRALIPLDIRQKILSVCKNG